MRVWAGIQRVLAIVLLVVLAPLEVVIALAVLRDTGKPMIHVGLRVGQNGGLLHIHKFRTMEAAARGPGITRRHDRRVTHVGHWLRKTRLDELPQLWDVARGSMLLVGPRPEDPQFVDMTQPAWGEILKVPPGITGPTQLAFAREEELLTEEDPERTYREVLLPAKITSDLAYVRTRSVTGDLMILLQTVRFAFNRSTRAP